MADALTLKLAHSLSITEQQAATLIAAGHDTPRKVEALGGDGIIALIGEVPDRIARTLALQKE